MTHEIIHERRGECEVKRFAEAMIEKLNEPKNLEKGGWKNCKLEYLLNRLRQEVEELEAELNRPIGCYPNSFVHANEIKKEAADVANFAMMIADGVGALEIEESQNPKGNDYRSDIGGEV